MQNPETQVSGLERAKRHGVWLARRITIGLSPHIYHDMAMELSQEAIAIWLETYDMRSVWRDTVRYARSLVRGRIACELLEDFAYRPQSYDTRKPDNPADTAYSNYEVYDRQDVDNYIKELAQEGYNADTLVKIQVLSREAQAVRAQDISHTARHEKLSALRRDFIGALAD